MSFRRNTSFANATRGPSQIFKKRNILFDTNLPVNSNATLIAEIVVDETATLYSAKVHISANSLASSGGDRQRVSLWLRCTRAGASLPDFTVAVESDTINGFHVGMVWGTSTQGAEAGQLREKFRFRRLCDENTLVQLIAQSTTVNGTGRAQDMTGSLALVLRVR